MLIPEVFSVPNRRSALHPYTPSPSIGFPSSSPPSSRRPVGLSHFHHPLLTPIDFLMLWRRLSSHSPIGLPIPLLSLSLACCPPDPPTSLSFADRLSRLNPYHPPTVFPICQPPIIFPICQTDPPTRRSASTSEVMSYSVVECITVICGDLIYISVLNSYMLGKYWKYDVISDSST